MSLLLLTCFLTGPPQTPVNSRLLTIENHDVRVGVDLDHGGAITWLSTAAESAPKRYRGRNLINNFDLGRQVQMSHYAGPVPFEPQGQAPADHWKHLGWNPVQSGDDFGNGSRVLSHERTDERIFIETSPLQWPLDAVESDAVFRTEITLEGPVILVTATVRIDRELSGESNVMRRHQELPAAYFLSAFDTIRIPTASGLSTLARKATGWTYWTPVEPWAAAVDDEGFGVGLLSPAAELFAGGVAGKGGSLESSASATTYLAPIKTVALKPKDTFTYTYRLTIGGEREIADRFQNRSAE